MEGEDQVKAVLRFYLRREQSLAFCLAERGSITSCCHLSAYSKPSFMAVSPFIRYTVSELLSGTTSRLSSTSRSWLCPSSTLSLSILVRASRVSYIKWELCLSHLP